MSRLEIVKTRTTTYKIRHIHLDALTFDEKYRRIRRNYSYSGFECYACNKRFKDGDKIAVIFTDKGIKVVCHECGVEIKSELDKQGG